MVNDKKTLCVAIPTFNKHENIQRKLESEIAVFNKYDIDIYIFDSSSDSLTEEVIEDYSKKGYSNIFLKKYNDNPSSNEKVYRIFEWAAEAGYEYLWMIHDHTVCNEEAIVFLMNILKSEKNDFLLLNMQAGEYKIEKFDDINDFLLKGAWRLNSFGASIVKTDTFLGGVDWTFMRRKYGDNKTLNYSHIGFYFERIAEMKYPLISQIFFERKDFIDFNRTKKIEWEKDTIRLCLECWGEVITRLPDVYENKREVLRSQDRWFLSKYSLLIYRKKGYFSFKEFYKYRKWLKTIFPEDYWRDFFICILPYKLAERFICKKLGDHLTEAKRKEKEIFIFGAGRHAVECASFLLERGTEFQGFIVSDIKGNPEELLNHKVYLAKKESLPSHITVLIAVLSSGVEEVIALLQNLTDEGMDIEIIKMM